MPITLGCPSCGKRFRARDESAGKRVKCPYCQAAVPVPSEEEAASAGAPTEVVQEPPPFLVPASSPKMPPVRAGSVPPPRPPQSRPQAPPPPVPVASPDEWGAGGEPLHVAPEPTFGPAHTNRPGRPGPIEIDEAPRDKGRPGKRPPKADAAAKTPEQLAAPGWRKAKGGLFWVLMGLFFLALPGFVPFGKQIYERSAGELPTDKDPGMVKIEGYVNTDDKDSVKINKAEELKYLAYGAPLLLAGFCLTLGRLTAGAAPRESGAKGLYAFSGMFTLIAVTGLVGFYVGKQLGFDDIRDYSKQGFIFGVVLAEFWFLIALAATAATVKQPGAVRTVGIFSLCVGLGVLIYFVGWDEYVKHTGRGAKPDAQVLLWEDAALLIGWLILIGSYYRAVKRTRVGIRSWLDDYEETHPKGK